MYIAEGDPDHRGRHSDSCFVLTDRPEQAKFLTTDEKGMDHGQDRLRASAEGGQKFALGKVLVLTLMYLFITLVSLGLLYYTPQITAWLKTSFGEVPPVVVVLIPYIFGTIGLLVWGRIADHNLWKAMINGKVLLLAVNYFGIVTASLGMLYFIPQIIKSLGNFSNMEGRLAHHDSLYLRRYRHGGVGGQVSDAMNERRWNLLVACVLSTGGLVLAGYTLGHVVGTGRNVVGRNRVLRLQGAVLCYAADVPQRHGARGGGLRMDQLDRQPGWHRRPLLCSDT